jgi:2-C-methyl-D-erythritol 2,4-cyclodiphosphate synthase
MRTRVGLGYDVHPFAADAPARPLLLGGVTIPGETGLDGHSDADAVAHAVADAVLGAAGLGDLGTIFPSSDPQLAGADSMALLADVAERVRIAGWWVGNVDVVIAAERPRLAPHVEQMAANLREALRGAAEPMGGGVFVSVQPKRGEGVGFVGRGEGIQVWAVALLER